MADTIPSQGSHKNLNLFRKALPGLLARGVLTPLDPILRLCARPVRRPQGSRPGDHATAPARSEPVFVFASYMVGDLFMALPALKRLAAVRPVRVLCRPDCAGLVAREGLVPVAFDNAFLTSRSAAAFRRTLRAARALRTHPEAAAATFAIDLDASPLSALWLRLAGFSRVASYRRAYGALFTETFDLPAEAVHQADRDEAVVGYVLEEMATHGLRAEGRGERDHENQHTIPGTTTASFGDTVSPPHQSSIINHQSVHTPWLFSVWTRKAAKNWPLEHWDELIAALVAEGVAIEILNPPDADDAFKAFRARWEPGDAASGARLSFVGGTLDDVADRVRGAAGVVATDNFLGHMAGYYGKPVLWINRSSPSAQVRPRGPRTLEVAAGDTGALAVESVARAFHALRRDA